MSLDSKVKACVALLDFEKTGTMKTTELERYQNCVYVCVCVCVCVCMCVCMYVCMYVYGVSFFTLWTTTCVFDRLLYLFHESHPKTGPMYLKDQARLKEIVSRVEGATQVKSGEPIPIQKLVELMMAAPDDIAMFEAAVKKMDEEVCSHFRVHLFCLHVPCAYVPCEPCEPCVPACLCAYMVHFYFYTYTNRFACDWVGFRDCPVVVPQMHRRKPSDVLPCLSVSRCDAHPLPRHVKLTSHHLFIGPLFFVAHGAVNGNAI
jgi:hypothetical protein